MGGAERRDAQPGRKVEGTGQQKIINCCCRAFVGTLKPVFQAPPVFPNLKRDIPAEIYRRVLTQLVWWLQAQSSPEILFFLHLSELIRMKMNSDLCALTSCVPRGRDGKGPRWQMVTGLGAVLSHVTSVHGLGICWRWHWAPWPWDDMGTAGDRARPTARLSQCFGEAEPVGRVCAMCCVPAVLREPCVPLLRDTCLVLPCPALPIMDFGVLQLYFYCFLPCWAFHPLSSTGMWFQPKSLL